MIGQDKHLKECFKPTPLTAFRRQTNLRDLLIKSKVPPPIKPYPQRNIRGMKRCAKSCTACPYILETKEIKIDSKNTWKIDRKMNCNNFNIFIRMSKEPMQTKIHRYYWASTQAPPSRAPGLHL